MTITEFIYQQLLVNGYKKDEVNFETIINVIEELIVYYSEFNSKNQTPSLLAAFLISKFEDKIFNYSIKGGVRTHGYKLNIPKGVNYDFSNHSYNNENPNQFFLQHLISLLLTEINNRISNYAYHTPSHSVIDAESENSLLLRKWMKKNNDEFILRLYSLNYDRIFKNILAKDDIDFFEGFDNPEAATLSNPIKPNVLKILSDFDSNTYYNLHGSTFWKVNARDSSQLLNPEIVFNGAPNLAINDTSSVIQIEKGKTILVSNIITGYQKAQKSMITPFKQMHYNFDKDCMFANELCIVGYSFGDTHINMSIKTALKYNSNLKLHFINPNYRESKPAHDGYKLLKDVFINIFPELLNSSFVT